MAKNKKRPDLFSPEIEQFSQGTGGKTILVTQENALELAKKENNPK